MENSRFFENVKELINTETKELESFCTALDNDPIAKRSRIAEYKCAKYRYAGIINVWCRFYHSQRVAAGNSVNHYLIPQVNDVFITVPEYVAFYDKAPDEEKRDYAFYYGFTAFTMTEIAKLKANLTNATDWERVELEERIGGLQFAKKCLDEAWQRRKDVI